MEESKPIINVNIDTGARQISLMTIGKERNWLVVLLLVVVTLGIYGFVYTYKLFEEAKRFVLVKNPTIPVTSGGAAVGYQFIPIFNIVWFFMLLFKFPGLISKMNKARGKGSEGWAWLGFLHLIPLLGSIAVFIITQVKINEIWREEREKLTGSSAVTSSAQQTVANQIESPVSELLTPKKTLAELPWQYIAPAIGAVLIVVLGVFLYGKYKSLSQNLLVLKSE